MKRFLLPLLILSAGAHAIELTGDFKGPLGLQLYSLRDSFKTDVPGTLDKVKALGFTEAEGWAGVGVTPAELVRLLKERGIKLVSTHFSYGPLNTQLEQCVKDAQTLGVKFAVCPWIDHEVGNFQMADVEKAATLCKKPEYEM